MSSVCFAILNNSEELGRDCACVYDSPITLQSHIFRRQTTPSDGLVSLAVLFVDFDFAAIPAPTSKAEEVRMSMDVTNVGSNQPTALRRRGLAVNSTSTSLHRRAWWDRFNQFAFHPEDSMQMRVDINQPLMHLEATCNNENVAARASLDFGLTGHARVYVQFGANVEGTFIPPRVDHVSADVSQDVTLHCFRVAD